MLFYRWNDIGSADKQLLLDYLAGQSRHNITSAIQVASRFGQINSFCDYLYEKSQQQNPTCLSNYWKPLIGD